MQNKPYVWVGRFYNHNKDSISLRLFRAARCLAGKMARKAVRKKYECDIEFNPANWFKVANVLERSHNPVITWIGHSTFLIQVGEINIITDPVFFNLSFFIIIPTMLNYFSFFAQITYGQIISNIKSYMFMSFFFFP